MKFRIGAWLSLGLIAPLLSACASGSIPTFEPVPPATVAVNETLRLSLAIDNPDNIALSFSFRTEEGDELGNTAAITGTSSGAQFRWSPLASQIGEHPITFIVTSSVGSSEVSTVITVVSARDQAPVFLLPGAGGSFDLSLTPCVDFDIEVRDDDSTDVIIRARAMLPDAFAQITETGAKSAHFHWCPTPEQVSAQERWTIRLEADDGEHPPTPHDYIAVLRGVPKPSCPGDAPTIAITAPADGARVSSSGPIPISIAASDDMGLRDAPLLYYARTAPANPAEPNPSEFEDQIEAEPAGGGFVARIPSMDLEIGEEVTLYIVASVTDNDDDSGTDCDHRTDSVLVSFTAVGALTSADTETCEPCTSSSECFSGFCAATASGGICLDVCAGEGASCTRGTCASTTTIEGGRTFACGDATEACATEPMCTDDGRENNDAIAQATTFASSIADGMICSEDDDYFKIAAAERSRVTVTLDGFEHADGDLDLQLMNASGVVLDASEGTSNSEVAQACAGADGFVYARVLGYDGAANSYHLSSSVESNVCCTDDSFEDDDTRETARVLSGSDFAGSICAGDADYIRFTTTMSRTVTVSIAFDGEVGDLDLELFDAMGMELDSSAGTESTESVSLVLPAGTYTIRVFGYDDAANTYTGTVMLSAP